MGAHQRNDCGARCCAGGGGLGGAAAGRSSSAARAALPAARRGGMRYLQQQAVNACMRSGVRVGGAACCTLALRSSRSSRRTPTGGQRAKRWSPWLTAAASSRARNARRHRCRRLRRRSEQQPVRSACNGELLTWLFGRTMSMHTSPTRPRRGTPALRCACAHRRTRSRPPNLLRRFSSGQRAISPPRRGRGLRSAMALWRLALALLALCARRADGTSAGPGSCSGCVAAPAGCRVRAWRPGMAR